MNYVYAAMLLHKSGKEVNEENVTEVLEAADIEVEEARVKSLVAALEDVNIDEAIKDAVITSGASQTGSQDTARSDESDDTEEDQAEDDGDDEAEEDEDVDEEEAAEGLGDLFG